MKASWNLGLWQDTAKAKADHLRRTEILMEHEGPQLVLREDANGMQWLELAVDDNGEHGDAWMIRSICAPLAAERVAQLKSTAITIREALTPERVLIVDRKGSEGLNSPVHRAWEVVREQVPETCLPAKWAKLLQPENDG